MVKAIGKVQEAVSVTLGWGKGSEHDPTSRGRETAVTGGSATSKGASPPRGHP